MAKSIRAQSSLRAKSVKRKSEFQKAYDAREARLSEKRQQELMDQKMDELKQKESEGKMDEEPPTRPVRVSTSGWRDANHLNWRRAHKKKRSKTTF